MSSPPPPPMELEMEVADETEEHSTDINTNTNRYALAARAMTTVEVWRNKFEEGQLSVSHFQDYWRMSVPSLYAPGPKTTCMHWFFDEELAFTILIHPLERFIWGIDDYQPVFRRQSTMCGRVFRQGEPAYSCRDCGMDNTCVLCVDCFKESAHKNHRYKMGQSSGGGCCDCGDTEAWKSAHTCNLHAAKEGEADDAKLSPDVVNRAKVVASVCLSYCLRMLTHDHAPGLPLDLRLKDNDKDLFEILDQPDCYCTVLYNDETHTFDQVITTLVRVMKCNQRDSVELVGQIDREGRALIRCNTFEVCEKLKTDIEIHMAMFERFTSRQGSPLKVLVMHSHVIAHQNFAMRLMAWLQSLVKMEPQLRVAVSQVTLGEDCGRLAGLLANVGLYGGGGLPAGDSMIVGSVPIATVIMQNDFRMWKAARNICHRFLIATALMDYESKKTLAILYTKNYGSILKDFIRDDHDHSYSISSLSVQLYTTPSIAHHLIAKYDALFVVMNTFVSECNRRCTDGRLSFDRNHVSVAFKRAQFILYDLKYLLSSIPTTFDDDLRRGFLHGLSLMFSLLVMMQGMDSVVRQVGQHMEYEPEWESAFNLHVKLAPSISLALEWCAADKMLTVSAYRMALRRHADSYTPPAKVVKELGNQSALVIPYDVSVEAVSIHRPLSRFIAGLHLSLAKHGLTYHSQEFDRPDMPKPTPEELLEPVLQTMAMIAQVHAGMWRRNGFALLNQLYFYHNVKCRTEMADRDVNMMQIAASLIDSDQFIIHILNKFNLLEWARTDFEQTNIDDDTLRHTISMVEEFLGLLIIIIGARYTPGVGDVSADDRVMKEIIQLLCVKPMAHSELNRSLSENQLHETGLETVIETVADFIKPPSPNHRGFYKLKPYLYVEYDAFYYHYTREELSRSEEEQRNRRKAAGLSECCPPPSLPKFLEPFNLCANMLQCDAVFHVLRLVFERALDLRARSFSEMQIHKALHLIAYAVREEQAGYYEFFAFSQRAERHGIVALLDKLALSPRVDAHKHFVKWVLNKIKFLLGQCENEENVNEKMDTNQEQSPTNKVEEAEKAKRAKLAAERRAKLMAQMKTQMNNFISNNATLFEETNTEVTADEQDLRPMYCSTALGVWGGGVPEPVRVCIMCQEETRLDMNSEPMVLVAFMQHSTVMNRWRGMTGWTATVGNGGAGRGAWLPVGIGLQPHVSSCGHALHARCCRKYIDSMQDKENRRPYRVRQPASLDVVNREYLCPLCERLCNTALPLLPAPSMPVGTPPQLSEDVYRESVNKILVFKHQVCSESVHVCTETCEEMHCQARARSVGAMSSDMEEESNDITEVYVATHSQNLLSAEFMKHFNEEIPEYNDVMKKLIGDFVLVMPVYQPGGLSMIAALYRATSYTIMCTNALLKAESRPLLVDVPSRLRDTLQALIRLAAAIPCVWSSPKDLAHHAWSCLNTLENTSPLTHYNFGTLVALVLAIPTLFGKQGPPARPTHLARQLTIQALRAEIFRAILVIDISSCNAQDNHKPKPDLENLLCIVKELRRGNEQEYAYLDPNRVWDEIRKQCHTFLRCCCIFYHFLSDIDPPTELSKADGDTWDVMCGYLDLPKTFKELLDNPVGLEKARYWVSVSSAWYSGFINPLIVTEPDEPPNLTKLPEDFSEIMNVVTRLTCRSSNNELIKNPSLCLVCGQFLCSQSYCCQSELPKFGHEGALVAERVGPVMAHATNCGGGYSIFLRVRSCELLLASAPARGAKLSAPYLDCYGETDQGLSRGNPLHLCPLRYASLRSLWLSHSIPERTSRVLDTNIMTTVTWQNY